MPESPEHHDRPRSQDVGKEDRLRRRVLNVRLLIASAVVLAVVVPGAWYWHGRQMGWLAQLNREKAESLEAEGQHAEAAVEWQRYLLIHPNDVDAQVRRAKSFAKAVVASRDGAHYGQAINLLYEAAGLAPDDQQVEIRRQLADALLTMGRFTEALRQADSILKADPRDKDAIRCRALALFALIDSGTIPPRQSDGKAAVTILEEALRLQPGDVQLARLVAGIYRGREDLLGDAEKALTEAQRRERADAIMDQMVRSAIDGDAARKEKGEPPQGVNALLTRYGYRRQHGLSDPQKDLQEAVRREPDHAAARFLLAEWTLAEGDRLRRGAGPDLAAAKAKFEEAREHYQHVLDSSKEPEPAAYLGLGLVQAAQGNPEGALKTWREGLAIVADARPNPMIEYQLNYRVVGALMELRRLDEVPGALRGLDESINRLVRGLPSDQQRAARQRLVRTRDLLQAQQLVGTRQFAQAAPLLERLVTEPWNAPNEESLAWRLLAYCRAGLNRPREAAEAYEQVLARQPKLLDVRLAAAGARREVPDVPAAIDHYERLFADAPADSVFQSPDNWLALATLRFQSEWAKPKEKRDWGPFEAALRGAKRTDGARPLQKPWELSLLEADYVLCRGVEQGKPAEAVDATVAALRKAETQFADRPDLLVALVTQYARLGRLEDADRALAACAKVLPNKARVYLLRAGLHLSRKESDQARQVLQEGLKTLPLAERPQVEHALVDLELARRDITEKQALARLEVVRSQAPDNLALVRRLADLALRMADREALARYEQELGRLEGTASPLYQYCRAHRLMAEASEGKTDRLAEVERLVGDLRQRQPNWDRTRLLAGQWCEARGETNEAIAEYEEAIRRGADEMSVYERLVRLLRQTQQLEKAGKYVAEARARSSSTDESRDLSGMAIDIAYRQGEVTAALEEARRGVEKRPEDALSRVWLGEMLEANQKLDEAEAEYKKAIDLAPSDGAAREALWTFYVRKGDWDRAREALQDYADKTTLTDAKRALLLARGREAMSVAPTNEKQEEDRKEALRFYAEAARLAPNDAGSVLGLARATTASDPKAAEKIVEGFLHRVPGDREAQRFLAVLLASRGGQQEWARAEAMLDEIVQDADAGRVERRLLAQMLLNRGGRANVEKAQKIMRQVVDDSKAPPPSDRQLLARLYDLGGKPDQARQQMAMLIDPGHPSPVHVAAYANLLLRQGELDEAARQIDLLERLAAGQLSTIMLRVRLLAKQGRGEAIEPLVEAAAGKLLTQAAQDKDGESRKRKEMAIASGIGGVYADAGMLAPAEKWYRRCLETTPGRYEALATILARQGRAGEAVELCAKAAETDGSPWPALALVSALAAGKPTEGDFKLAEPLLAKVEAAHKDDPSLLLALATVEILRGQTAKAVVLHEQLLQKNPNHVAAMNNLASILAESPGDRKKAAEWVDRGIAVAGPQAMLLDTKAWISLLDGKAEAAVPLLEEVTASAGSDPRFDLHLAGAYDRLGKSEQAKVALKKARDNRLEDQVLTKTERSLLDELQRKHGS